MSEHGERGGASDDGAYVRSHFVDEAVGRYAAAHTSPADAVQRRLRATTAEVAGQWAVMQVGDDQAVLLEILARAIGARHAVEVGTFTGSSALAIARGLGPGGKLLCCDISEEWTAVARDAWEQAGVADRIELRIAPAIDTLRELPENEHIDLVFLDADKTGYAAYFDELVPRLRPGGLLLADNTLQWGRVADESVTDESVVAIRAFNDKVLADERVRCVLLPVGDGVTVIQKVDGS
jgi:caffeoyl-CoA O-methyltransferase